MDNKYGKTPKQRLDDALNQPEQTNAQWVKERMIIEPGKEPYFVSLEAIGLKDALDRVCIELEKSKDPDSLYYAWQSNIAMAFADAYKKWHSDNGYIFSNANFESTLYEISNNAAKNFLNSLCNQSKNIETKKQSE